MTYEKIEDVPEKDVARSIDYMQAVARLASSRTAVRVASDIAKDTLLRGECRLTHREFERRTGACRRTMQRVIRNLIDARLIKRTGTTDTGQAIYVAEFDRADEYREWGRRFDREWADARKGQRLKLFKAPAYPAAGDSHGEA